MHPPYVREEEADFCVRDWALLRADCRVFAKEERKSWKNAKKEWGTPNTYGPDGKRRNPTSLEHLAVKDFVLFLTR